MATSVEEQMKQVMERLDREASSPEFATYSKLEAERAILQYKHDMLAKDILALLSKISNALGIFPTNNPNYRPFRQISMPAKERLRSLYARMPTHDFAPSEWGAITQYLNSTLEEVDFLNKKIDEIEQEELKAKELFDSKKKNGDYLV